jgi:sigma-E factor negative regulatory protein RseB
MPRPSGASRPLLGLALTWAVSGAALAEGGTKGPLSPAQWLERMNVALTTRNYDGVFSHWHGGRVETLRIIHRLQDGTVSERLASLDGSGREFIRTGASLACYLPDTHTVVVEERPEQQSLVGFPTVDVDKAQLYELREVARTRLNRRDTHVITVSPRDEYRYGYRLWIDDSTAMPLKSQLCDAHGEVIEQIVFASLKLTAHIPDSAFKPDVSTAGFRWLRNDPALPPAAAALAWEAMQLPPGFKMASHSAQTLPGSPGPVDHLVFTDGFASVSVFVERQTAAPDQPAVTESAAAVGSSSAYSTVIDGHKITAVGEVPPATVRFIATQLKAQDQPAGGATRPH